MKPTSRSNAGLSHPRLETGGRRTATGKKNCGQAGRACSRRYDRATPPSLVALLSPDGSHASALPALRLQTHEQNHRVRCLKEPEEGNNPTEKNSDREATGLYAISIEQGLAAEILTGLRPSRCCFWQTDHRGLLLIHTRARTPARGVFASGRDSGRNSLVGVVELVDCIASEVGGADPDEIEYHWVLVNPRVFFPHIPYAGRPGLFLVTQGVVAAAVQQAGMSKQPRR